MLCCSVVSAQTFESPDTRPSSKYLSSFYLEVGGTNSVASFNYDMIVNQNVVIRVGLSPSVLFAISEEDKYLDNQSKEMNFSGVITAGRITGRSNHHFETGIGYVFGEINRTPSSSFPRPGGLVLNAGYRFISTIDKGITFRAMFTPILNSDGLTPWAGLSFGYSFSGSKR